MLRVLRKVEGAIDIRAFVLGALLALVLTLSGMMVIPGIVNAYDCGPNPNCDSWVKIADCTDYPQCNCGLWRRQCTGGNYQYETCCQGQSCVCGAICGISC